MTEQEQISEHLKFLQGLVGGDKEKEKTVCGEAFSKEKTPAELYAEEMAALQALGYDYGNQEGIRRAIFKASRGVRG